MMRKNGKLTIGVRKESKTRAYEDKLSNMMDAAWEQAPLSKPIGISICFGFSKQTGRVAMIDLSNLIKSLEDAGNGILWDDDKQIREYGKMSFRYGQDGIRLEIWEL